MTSFQDTDIGHIHPVNRRLAIDRERAKAAAMVSAGLVLETLPKREPWPLEEFEHPEPDNVRKAPDGAGVVYALVFCPLVVVLVIAVAKVLL